MCLYNPLWYPTCYDLPPAEFRYFFHIQPTYDLQIFPLFFIISFASLNITAKQRTSKKKKVVEETFENQGKGDFISKYPLQQSVTVAIHPSSGKRFPCIHRRKLLYSCSYLSWRVCENMKNIYFPRSPLDSLACTGRCQFLSLDISLWCALKFLLLSSLHLAQAQRTRPSEQLRALFPSPQLTREGCLSSQYLKALREPATSLH